MLKLWRKIRTTRADCRAATGRGRAGWVGQIRHVDAGSCNWCEVEIGSAFGPIYDAERYGARLVASPLYADAVLMIGPVTRNMAGPLRRTYEAVRRRRWWSRSETGPAIAACLPRPTVWSVPCPTCARRGRRAIDHVAVSGCSHPDGDATTLNDTTDQVTADLYQAGAYVGQRRTYLVITAHDLLRHTATLLSDGFRVALIARTPRLPRPRARQRPVAGGVPVHRRRSDRAGLPAHQ